MRKKNNPVSMEEKVEAIARIIAGIVGDEKFHGLYTETSKEIIKIATAKYVEEE